MHLPEPIAHYLQEQGVTYRLITAQPDTLSRIAEGLDVPPDRVMRIVLLKEEVGRVMVVLPSNYILDFSILCDLLQRELDPMHGMETAQFFHPYGCKPSSYPPLPVVFGVNALVDNHLKTIPDDEEVYFDGGNGETIVAIPATDYRKLLSGAQWANFSVPLRYLDTLMREGGFTPEHLMDMTHRYTPIGLNQDMENISELPAMPPMAEYLLALRDNPDAGIRDILRVIEQDPSLAAVIIYAARSPLHGYSGPVDSLTVAVEDILGIECTLNLLLATTMGRVFSVPNNGPVGLEAFWRESVYCAAFVSELVRVLPYPVAVKPGLAYLAGLVHNFGYLVLGHLFPARFFLFNRFLAVNPQVPLSTIERYVLGIEHTHIGAWLMQAWSLPDEIVSAARWHHNEDCTQDHAEYSGLVMIADRMLYNMGISQNGGGAFPSLASFTLGIGKEQAIGILARIECSVSQLNALSDALRAPVQE